MAPWRPTLPLLLSLNAGFVDTAILVPKVILLVLGAVLAIHFGLFHEGDAWPAIWSLQSAARWPRCSMHRRLVLHGAAAYHRHNAVNRL
jgi:hypothetical protein